MRPLHHHSRIGLGCMRLSTERDRDETRGVAVIHAALDAGIRLLDTADAYCLDDTERGHNERLIAAALAAWPGDRADVRVATKGGLTRPDGRWEPDGRARHLRDACEVSLRALHVERLDLYQLHVPDPRTPLATSVRALAALQREGLVDAVGLCNVTVGQIEEARRLVEIAAVQVELSVWQDAAALGGVLDYCRSHDITLLAHRPLGGAARTRRTATDPILAAVAARHDATPFEIALAWLRDLADVIVPLPGATRVDNARAIARARTIALTDADRAQLDATFGVWSQRSWDPPSASGPLPPSTWGPPSGGPSPSSGPLDGEVVLIMGLPAAGKSTLAERLIADGYQRLNRDASGGTLRDLLPALDATLATPSPRVVLDNTYVSRKSRAEVLRVAAAHGVPVRCVWLSTSLEDAQTNAVWRLVDRYGALPDEAQLKTLRKQDVAAFLPTVQFRYQRELEPPDIAEGFSHVETIPFTRRLDPSFVERALLVWCDDVLVRSRGGQRAALTIDDTEVMRERGAQLRRHRDEGWRVFGLSWQPEIAAGRHAREPTRCSHTSRRNSASRCRLSTARMPPDHPPAGAASRCLDSASSSSNAIASIRHDACMSVRDRKIPASPGASACPTGLRMSSLVHGRPESRPLQEIGWQFRSQNAECRTIVTNLKSEI